MCVCGQAMLAAFNGKGKNVLTKFKLNEKKLDEQKKKIADNTVVPATHKHAAHHKIEAKHAAKKVRPWCLALLARRRPT